MPTSLLIHLYFPDENSEKVSVIEKHGILESHSFFWKILFCFQPEEGKRCGCGGKSIKPGSLTDFYDFTGEIRVCGYIIDQ